MPCPRTVAIAIVLPMLSLLLCASLALADAEGAKKYIEEAKKQIVSGDMDKAEVELKLADAELDGLPPTDATVKEVAALRGQMAAAGDVKAKTEMMRSLEYNMRMSKEGIKDPGTLKESTGIVETLVNSDDGKKFLTDAQRADYIKQIAALRKAGAVMTLDRDVVTIDQSLKRAEEKLPDVLASVKERGTETNSDVDHLNTDIEQLKKELGNLPADNAKVKPLLARLATLSSAFDAAVNTGMTAETVAQLKRSWDIYENEWGGWEQETNTPTWEEFRGKAGGGVEELYQPKTVALVTRANGFLKNIQESDRLKSQASQPAVKAVIDDVTKKREAAFAKLVTSINKVLDGAEKDTLDKDKAQKLGYFVDNIRLMLDSDPRMVPLQDRAKAMVAKVEGAMAAGAKATGELVTKLKEQAKTAWPGMSGKFPENDASFDPSDALKNIGKYKGKTLRFNDTNNRINWDYTGDYDFAVTRNGIPVVGRFDPAVRTAIRAVEEKSKENFGDYECDVIAVIDGVGKVQKRQSADVTSNGTTIGRVEGNETVDAVVLRIVGAYAGPFAAAAGVGAVGENGSVTPIAAAGGSAASSGGGWLWRFLTLVIGLGAAACCLLKANFAPLASVPQVGAVRTKLGDENFGYLGIAIAVLGVLWLLRGYIIFGLFTSLAIIAAGLYVALDVLEAKGIVKPDQAAKIRPLGVMIGLACAALVVLSFLTGGALRVI